MKRVVVTGATGFVGRHCLAPLEARGFEVHAVAAEPSSHAHAHVCDLLDPDATARLLAELRPSHLLHLAWYATPGSYWTAQDNLRWVGATLALATAFRASGGTRFVGVGSCAEYDWSSGRCDEATTALAPHTLYGTAKHATHEVLASWGARHGVEVAWGRLFFLYGPHEHPDRLVASVIRACLERREARCTAGTQRRDFQHVADAGGAIAALVDSDVTGAVNIASGETVAVRDVVLAIAERTQAHDLIRLGALPMPSGEPAELVASVARLRSEVGWTDRYDLARGLDDTIAWWRT